MANVYRSGNSFSDTRQGPDDADLARVIRKLTGTQRRRISGRLLDASPQRDAIGKERASAPREATGTAEVSGSEGIASPLTEQAYEGATYYSLVSSDGLFIYEFPDETTYLDADLREVVVRHLDPEA